MDGVDALLEVPFVHDGILTIFTGLCILTGAVGDRFKLCPQFVHQFGEPMYPVVENYILSKDRICNEHFGLCKSPIIEKIDLNKVVKDILATKPVSLANDDYI